MQPSPEQHPEELLINATSNLPPSGKRKGIAWVTILCILICILLFIGIHLNGNLDSWDTFRKWGAPSSTDIWKGDYWGLITSNFLHVADWHLIFNLYWLWRFGRIIEQRASSLFLILLIVSCGLFGSLFEIAFTDTAGHGLSGVVYGLFGFIWARSRWDDTYKNLIGRNTILVFIVWLILCVVLTYQSVFAVSNAAHIGGLIWGFLLARLPRIRYPFRIAIPAAIMMILSVPVFWKPWSAEWLSVRVYRLMEAQKIEKAETLCRDILAIDSGNVFAKENLRVIRIHRLGQRAYNAHTAGRYEEAKKLYLQILSIDPKDSWARENLLMIQAEVETAPY